ncbi:nucleoside phosphorylase [Streptomyces sp. MC1]|uniref:nucleoside phosphorylase n=1 Tax=Streptomyces sp. MC1 TaxID=295105 RepID=UPI0018CB24E5|nr:nucleoside phosphorylase [Streptomyces sp. MC1]MBG7704811.1 nucleoside phosphorylase [Streptomyces sp. MC1]
MTFPLLTGKHTFRAVTNPAEHAAYIQGRDPAASLKTADGVVLLYQRSLMQHAATAYPGQHLPWVRGDLLLVERRGRSLAICGGFGLGAPAAALVLEQVIALGARRVVTVGTAASLRTDLVAGDLVVCDTALRDEGVSHHYMAPGTHAKPSKRLTTCLAEALQDKGVSARRGPGWTIDAPYRETEAEVARYGRMGVLTADMEAAAVFAVAGHRGIDAATVFVVADSLLDRRPRMDRSETVHALRTALDCALSALSRAAQKERRR